MGKKGIKLGPVPPGGICKERKVHMGERALGREQVEPQSGNPSPRVLHGGDKPPCLGNPLRQIGLEKPRLYSQEVHMCWLANSQGGESLVLAAAASPHFPIQRGKHPSPAHSTLQPGTRSGQRLGLVTWRQTRAPGE